MDYEKRYNEALERAKQFMSEHPTREEADLMVALFPELAESEDERIRKWLEDYFKSVGKSWIHRDISPEQILSYLEKQKDLKYSEEHMEDIRQYAYNKGIMDEREKKKEPHFTKRNALFDKCVENCDPEIMKKVSDEIDAMLEKEQKPSCWESPVMTHEMIMEKQKEQKPAEWEDYKDKVNIPYCSSEPEVDLEEAAEEYVTDWTTCYANEIEQAFIAGAKWQYQKDRGEFAKIKAKTWCEGFDACKEQMPLPEDTVIFQKGVEEGKRLMMENALDGVAHPDDCEIWVNLVGYGYDIKEGSKVKVIIVKDDWMKDDYYGG